MNFYHWKRREVVKLLRGATACPLAVQEKMTYRFTF